MWSGERDADASISIILSVARRWDFLVAFDLQQQINNVFLILVVLLVVWQSLLLMVLRHLPLSDLLFQLVMVAPGHLHPRIDLSSLLLVTPHLLLRMLDYLVVLALNLFIICVLQVLLLKPEVLSLLLNFLLVVLILSNIERPQLISLDFLNMTQILDLEQPITSFVLRLCSLNSLLIFLLVLFNHLLLDNLRRCEFLRQFLL